MNFRLLKILFYAFQFLNHIIFKKNLTLKNVTHAMGEGRPGESRKKRKKVSEIISMLFRLNHQKKKRQNTEKEGWERKEITFLYLTNFIFQETSHI
jgi:hypothetical protein